MSRTSYITVAAIQSFREFLKTNVEENKRIKETRLNGADDYYSAGMLDMVDLLTKQARFWEGKQSEAELILKYFETYFADEIAEEL